MSVKVTTRFTAIVGSLSDAWAFVLDHLDRVGESPSIEIRPNQHVLYGALERPISFEVEISGVIYEQREDKLP